MNDDLELSRELTRVVASVAGVIEVYSAGSLGKVVALDLINAVVPATIEDAKVVVRSGEADVLSIAATIGVDSSQPVQRTLRTVGDAIRAHLVGLGVALPEVNVKVSYID